MYKIQTQFQKENQKLYHQWEFICKVNINIEMSLVILTYNTMTSIMMMHSLAKTSTQHYYNRNYKTLTWCLHDPITIKSYEISSEMEVETMPHAMYFSGSIEAVTKINHVPYQTIEYDDKGMFQKKLMDDTQVQIFIDNGATLSILPLNIYVKYPILQKYPKTESYTPIHTGGYMIESHLRIEIPLKLDNQIIQIKALVCVSKCPCNIVLGCTSLAQLSAWQDYASKQLHKQQISIPLIVKNNILPSKTGIISLVLKPTKHLLSHVIQLLEKALHTLDHLF